MKFRVRVFTVRSGALGARVGVGVGGLDVGSLAFTTSEMWLSDRGRVTPLG